MDRSQAISLVRGTFTKPFDEVRFRHFVRNLVNHLDEATKLHFSGNLVKRAFATQVGHYSRLGTYTDPRSERVDVLVIHLRKDTTLARGRVTLRNFVADYLTTGHGQGKAAVIGAFVSPLEDDWRFSFIKLDYSLETTELGFVTERAELTPARRYSYLVGQNENCHTAQKQFLELLQTDSADPTVDILEKAFSVEKVTKEFFEQYRLLFEKTRDALSNFLNATPQIAQEFDTRGITQADFAKKLLGQIVFLYFLQKKGWFGVERGLPWGSGRRDFIRHLFKYRDSYSGFSHSSPCRSSNFFNDILEPLFYEALAAPRLDDDHYYSRFDCRIPFLNGGLFEPLYGYKWVETDILLPDALFSNEDMSEDEDIGTGILDVFDRYNFTINEAEPLETEVAVDPEMLGKVFENLLPENMRHISGTYYTPRVIVHFMCQQVLLNYLVSHVPGIPRDSVVIFLRLAERFADFEARETKNHADKRLPTPISENAALLDELLARITVCDPAIGSGAFPVGMMHEIVRARMALTPVLDKSRTAVVIDNISDRSPYSLKRHAIQQSLYGVDEDPGAVEIAKLRLWLSMVVDEDEISEIQPLPNLDYKIMQGNSLLQEFEGVKLLNEQLLTQEDDESHPAVHHIDERLRSIEKEVSELQAEGRLNRDLATELKSEAAVLTKQRKTLLHPRSGDSGQHVLALGSRGSLKRIQQLHAQFFDESSRVKKEMLRAELDKLEWEFMRATLREQGQERALTELERASAKHRKPFFLWKLQFPEVFQRDGGFDVIIANPPYVRMELIKELKPALKRRFDSLFTGRADLYVYFFGIGLEVLREGGCLAFISSNTYLNSKFGENLRKHFSDEATLLILIDFAETHVFDAVVEPAIIVLRKSRSEDVWARCIKWQENQPIDDLPDVAANRAQLLSQKAFSSEPWRIVEDTESQLLEKMNRGTPLKDLAPDGILYGVKTGLNRAFIIDDQRRRELCEDIRSAEIIKPFIRGRDISRWSVRPIEAWLIYTHHGIDIKRYPLIEAYLRTYKPALESRATHQEWYELQQPQYRYSKTFTKPKIVYQDISRTFAFAYDAEGCYCGDTTFVLPTPSLAILGVLQSNVTRWWVHTDQGVPFGGFLRLKAQYMQRCPVPPMQKREEETLSWLVSYLLSIHRRLAAILPEAKVEDLLMAEYFERWMNALVYELVFPDALHKANLRFFHQTEQAGLGPLIPSRQASELEILRQLFERLYEPNHPLRQSLFALDAIDEVRIVEEKG
jgi:type I restriction-modification system DNA methylase subunit